MTIDDQIKDEKLQYDINREAAKILAWSSVKIDNYEYVIGKEILHSNQKQIKEQAKFTYSPLAKAFEKKKKSNRISRRKTNKSDSKPNTNWINKKHSYSDENSPLILKQKKIFDKLVDERLEEITVLDKKKLILMI